MKANTLSLRQAWLVWFVAAFYVLFQVGLQTSMSVMVAPIKADLNLTYTELGLLSAAFFYSYMIMQIPSGSLVDSLGPRLVFLYSLALTSIACFLYAKSTGFWTAAFCRFLIGIGVSPAINLAMTIGARWFPISMFALIAGLTESLGMLGGVAGEQGLSLFINSELGWRGTMAGCSLVGVLLFMVAYYVMPTIDAAKKVRGNSIDLKKISALIKQPQLMLNGLYAAFSFAVVLVFASLWGVPYIRFAFHTDLITSASICSLFFIGSAVGTPLIGLLENKVANRSHLMMGLSFFSFILMCLVLFPYILSLIELSLILFILGILTSSYILPFVLIKEVADDGQKGVAIGYTNMMCFVIGAPLLQPVTGSILQSLGSTQIIHYQLALLSMPLCYLGAFMVSFFIKDPKQPSHGSERQAMG